MRLVGLALALFACSACANVPPEATEPERRGVEGSCDAGSVQTYLGQKATAELGASLLGRTGARILRWLPPRTATTMDYRPDRLTVGYDDDYVIGRISCG